MEQEFHPEEEQEQINSHELAAKSEKSSNHQFPPRSTVHRNKDDKKHTSKINNLQMMVAAFVFLIIITAAILYQLPKQEENLEGQPINTPEFEVNLNDTTQSKETEQSIGNDNSDREQSSVEQESSVPQQPIMEDSQEIIDNNNTANYKIHVVQPGENLFRISLKYYNSGQYVEALAKYNELNSPGEIYSGFKLKIPEKQVLE